MREPISELRVTDFDFSRFNGAEGRLAQNGYEIMALPELQVRDPEWLTKLYELDWDVSRDIPSPDPPIQQPLDEWRKLFSHPEFCAEAWFVAIKGDEWVGISNLWVVESNPKKLYTGLTGVSRAHRRQGLALAMKLRAIEFAQQRGAERIETENEENNPMLGINIRLGFTTTPASVIYEKRLAS
ncbi:MAG: GNAT family N-acetyltransferase [Caldilineaceae bacterium]|nr:GNAT family N-acetyltransferase [Caldilineaceae bacterium]